MKRYIRYMKSLFRNQDAVSDEEVVFRNRLAGFLIAANLVLWTSAYIERTGQSPGAGLLLLWVIALFSIVFFVG